MDDEAVLNLNALLTASEAATYTGKSVAAICNWRARGWLPVATDGQGREIRDRRGRPRYRLIDVAKADRATNERAEKMARNLRPRSFPAAA